LAENASFDVLIDGIRRSVFAVGDDKKKRKGKGREGKVHKVTRRYILAICGADTPRPIPIKFGMRIAPRNIINVSNFVIKFSGVSDLQGVKIPVFPLTLLVIVTTVLHYRAACDLSNCFLIILVHKNLRCNQVQWIF